MADCANAVAVNVPILRPNVAGRVWLSDGSLPTNILVYPPKLAALSPFSQYKARPFAGLATVGADTTKSAHAVLDIELGRLHCVTELLKSKDWTSFIWRVTAFDLLTHIFGLNFFAAADLQIYAKFQSFVHELDETFAALIAAPEVRLVLVSGYSHVECRQTLNLNQVLEQGGFLRFEAARQGLHRRGTDRFSAAAVVTGSEPGLNQLGSGEGRIDLQQTVAASPVSGCVYINKNSCFEDGIVGDDEIVKVRRDVHSYLKKTLESTFGSGVSIEANPLICAYEKTAVPDFIVSIDGVELHDMKESAFREYDLPRTTHHPAGFVWMPGSSASTAGTLNLTQIRGLLADGNNEC